MYDNGNGVPDDDAEAVRWYRLSVEQGFAAAQYNLGLMYEHGNGVPEDDAEAARWYRLSAEQGFASAQYNLGLMYAEGNGVPEDDAEAVRWYRLAAEQGHASAQEQPWTDVRAMVTASWRTMQRPHAGIGFLPSKGMLSPSSTLE